MFNLTAYTIFATWKDPRPYPDQGTCSSPDQRTWSSRSTWCDFDCAS